MASLHVTVTNKEIVCRNYTRDAELGLSMRLCGHGDGSISKSNLDTQRYASTK
jgi:hypothetical protein